MKQYQQRNEISIFFCGEVFEDDGLRTEPCGIPALGLIWLDMKPFMLTCIKRQTSKSKNQRVTLVERLSMNISYLSSLCQTLLTAFYISRKVTTTWYSLLKFSVKDWDMLNTWSSVDFDSLSVT